AGTNEILLDDSTRMATRAREAGVDVILDITADVPHVFQAFAGVLDEADEALERAALFLSQHICTSGTAHTPASSRRSDDLNRTTFHTPCPGSPSPSLTAGAPPRSEGLSRPRGAFAVGGGPLGDARSSCVVRVQLADNKGEFV